MNLITDKNKICKDIADALGIKHCKALDIHFGTGDVATVRAEYYPEIDGVRQFPAILIEFNLIAKEQNHGQNNETD